MLQQDIDQLGVWIERIESATWVDHIRRLDRYTTTEHELATHVAKFRTSAGRAVRRMIEFPRAFAAIVAAHPDAG
jgi:hypothetical protein